MGDESFWPRMDRGVRNLQIESVIERPWPVGSEVRVISVPVSGGRGQSGYIDVASWEAIRGSSIIEANRIVNEALGWLQKNQLKAEGTVSEGLDGPRALILDEAEQWEADLIVAGSHGLRGWDRFLGSVSETLALHALCSVEVIRGSKSDEQGTTGVRDRL